MMLDSRGIVKNIEVLDSKSPDQAEEDCESDSDSVSADNDARKMFSNRSIKDLSLVNFQKFKLLNQES